MEQQKEKYTCTKCGVSFLSMTGSAASARKNEISRLGLLIERIKAGRISPVLIPFGLA